MLPSIEPHESGPLGVLPSLDPLPHMHDIPTQTNLTTATGEMHPHADPNKFGLLSLQQHTQPKHSPTRFVKRKMRQMTVPTEAREAFVDMEDLDDVYWMVVHYADEAKQEDFASRKALRLRWEVQEDLPACTTAQEVQDLLGSLFARHVADTAIVSDKIMVRGLCWLLCELKEVMEDMAEQYDVQVPAHVQAYKHGRPI